MRTMTTWRVFSRALASVLTFVAALVACSLATDLKAQTYEITTYGSSTDDTDSVDRFTRYGPLAVDGAGNVFVFYQGCIRRISAGKVTTLAGRQNTSGFADGAGDVARFGHVSGLARTAAGDLFVIDAGNRAIRRVTAEGAVTTVAGGPTRETQDGVGTGAGFDWPSSVTADSAGNLFVADGSTIRRMAPTGMVTTIAGSRHASGENRDGVGADARFHDIRGLAVDPAGNVVVAHGSMLRKISPSGTVSTLAGSENRRGHRDGPLAEAEFQDIQGIAADGSGHLFVAERFVVRIVTPAGEVSTVAGQPLEWGYRDGLGGNARLDGVRSIAADTRGSFFLRADSPVVRRGTPVNSPAPPVLLTLLKEQSRAAGAGAQVEFSVSAAGTAPLAYQWFKNDTPLSGATRATLTLTGVTAADAGLYLARISNIAGSIAPSHAASLSVYEPTLGAFSLRHERSGGEFLWGIASGARTLIAVGTGGTILSSLDGTTWTRRNSPVREWLLGIAYGAGKFVAVGDRGLVLNSTDGITWSKVSGSATSERLNNVIYAGGMFVAVGERGALVTSRDGVAWTARATHVTGWLRGLAYTTRPRPWFFATGQNGAQIRSADGESWGAPLMIPKSAPVPLRDLEATVAGGWPAFRSVGQDGVIASAGEFANVIIHRDEQRRPTNFTTIYGWEAKQTSIGIPARFRGLATGANALFAMGEDGAILAAPGVEGPWARMHTGTRANLVSGVFYGNSLFVVGEHETILQSTPLYRSRLLNVSTRGQIGGPIGEMIGGFVVAGRTPKPILLRAAGPALSGFGVGVAASAPHLSLVDEAGRELAANAGWSAVSNATSIAETAARVGAFPFAPGSRDSALLVNLAPGAYTARVTNSAGSPGVALFEAYDADGLATEETRTINISTRGFVGTGENKLVAGFFIGGAESRRLLIRGVGPSLSAFGVPDVLAEPRLEIFGFGLRTGGTYQAWFKEHNSDEIRAAAVVSGAFPLLEAGHDAAIVTTLQPGNWTIQVSGNNNTTGLALVEIFDLP